MGGNTRNEADARELSATKSTVPSWSIAGCRFNGPLSPLRNLGQLTLHRHSLPNKTGIAGISDRNNPAVLLFCLPGAGHKLTGCRDFGPHYHEQHRTAQPAKPSGTAMAFCVTPLLFLSGSAVHLVCIIDTRVRGPCLAPSFLSRPASAGSVGRRQRTATMLVVGAGCRKAGVGFFGCWQGGTSVYLSPIVIVAVFTVAVLRATSDIPSPLFSFSPSRILDTLPHLIFSLNPPTLPSQYLVVVRNVAGRAEKGARAMWNTSVLPSHRIFCVTAGHVALRGYLLFSCFLLLSRPALPSWLGWAWCHTSGSGTRRRSSWPARSCLLWKERAKRSRYPIPLGRGVGDGSCWSSCWLGCGLGKMRVRGELAHCSVVAGKGALSAWAGIEACPVCLLLGCF
ncbi:hypothetical protein F5144DRAFT_143725 [Chaetomium tenue]|uniref:Uncharacterized protein n=1 Tax=Chaetomium tenue TaxID=1854479 RepID=A0ACB7PLS5_9PEZI|nr:hypothetical protein F5144DRAFT_143725 [Chaetomium globosum]